MSAAEPAHPRRSEPANAVSATVLTFRRSRHQSRQARVPHPQDPAGQPAPNSLPPELRLAASIERVFADHGRSLTDEDTGLDYTITLAVFRKLLEGAHDQGKLSDDEFGMLAGMVEGMLEAPRLLA